MEFSEIKFQDSSSKTFFVNPLNHCLIVSKFSRRARLLEFESYTWPVLLGARLNAKEKDKIKEYHSVLGVDNFKDTFLKPLEEVDFDSVIVRPDGDPELAGNW